MKNYDLSFDLPAYLAREKSFVEAGLKKILNQLDHDRELTRAMSHSLLAGGKRLRPILSLAAARACGKDPQMALPAGCTIEMIHTYSLIHDDLPAMDNDDLRRGIPTCHKQFSEATAILAGDGLLTHAFKVLAAPEKFFNLFPDTATRLELVALIAGAAGVNGMIEGQMLDMQSESHGLDSILEQQGKKPGNKEDLLAHLKKIHQHKTGEMIRVSVEAGALSAGAEATMLTPLIAYANKIGLAFQVMDDILNVEGDPEIMGKAAGSDALHDKITFPSLMGLKGSKLFAEQLIEKALGHLENFDYNADPLRAIASYIISRDR